MAKTRTNKPRQLDAELLSAIPLLAGEPVLMGEMHAKSLLARITQPLPRSLSDDAAPVGEASLEISRDIVAVIPIIGTLTKYATWFDGFCGLCPTTTAEQLLALAIANPSVKEIVLSIDSPGGFVNGTVAFADAVAAANQIKPVTAFIHGQCCSGAYFVASQCAKIYARRESSIGSIGVYSVLADVTRLYEAMGIAFTLVTSGINKGLGADGKVTDARIQENQRCVTGLHEQFVASVCDGRNMTPAQINPLADGRTFLGPDAKQLGLIDGVVSTFDAALQAVTDGATAPDGANMAKTQTAPRAATPANRQAPKAGDDSATAPTNDDVRTSLNDAKASADSHTGKARAAMDNYKSMTDDADDDTKALCTQTAAALKACADESTRCANALEGSEDGADEDEEGQQNAKGSPVSFGAKEYMSAFGNQGAVWFLEKKPFAAAATEFVSQLKASHKTELDAVKAENETLKTKLKSIDLGNPSAGFNVAEGKAGTEHAKGGGSDARQMYINNTTLPGKPNRN